MVDYRLLQFEQLWLPDRRKFVDVGMPATPIGFTRGVFYLFKSVEDAKTGGRAGGTGFIMHVPSKHEGYGFQYAITNWHAAVREGFSVMRFNQTEGKTPLIVERDPGEWEFIPGGPDLAANPLYDVNSDDMEARAIPEYALVTREILKSRTIGPGDNVFMVGKFVDHDGGPRNEPGARFGNLSMMPLPMKRIGVNYATAEAYVVDMRSRAGYSGSPVYVYRTPTDVIDIATEKAFFEPPRGIDALNVIPPFLGLLGVHVSQFEEEWAVDLMMHDKEGNRTSTEGTDYVVAAKSSMTCVAPAWQLKELLHVAKFTKQREFFDAELGKRLANEPRPPAPESSKSELPAKEVKDDDKHRERFTALLDEAVGKPKRGD